jgi:Phage terminase, small subunit
VTVPLPPPQPAESIFSELQSEAPLPLNLLRFTCRDRIANLAKSRDFFWLTIANKQLELMHKYLSEFGLSPVSRSRVSTRPLTKSPSKFAGLLGPRPWIPADEYLKPREG